MVDVDIWDPMVTIRPQGWYKTWCFRSSVAFNLSSITKIYKKPNGFRAPWLRTFGTHIPWLITAGAFRRKGEREFWCSKYGRDSVVIEMEGEEFHRIVVDVPEVSQVVDILSEKVSVLKSAL